MVRGLMVGGQMRTPNQVAAGGLVVSVALVGLSTWLRCFQQCKMASSYLEGGNSARGNRRPAGIPAIGRS
jgi:hypothetical protein